MTSSDPFEHFDGAYVLGALDDGDQRAFEAHLQTCPACRARVDEVRPMAGLLAGLPASAYENPEPVPDTLLPVLLRRAAGERARRRWFTTAVAAVAAACVVALAVVLVGGGSSGASSGGHPARALAQLLPGPLTASASVVDRPWGTEIDLQCHYSAGVTSREPYRLVVVDRSNASHDAGSWTLVPGKQEVTFTGGTSVPSKQIHYVEVTTLSGLPILRLTL